MRYAMVCSSNQNRSMEAHLLLKRHGFAVESYGTGGHVKLPGPSLHEPNVYDFGTPYKSMFDELRRKDPDLNAFVINRLNPLFLEDFTQLNNIMNLYKRNGILAMLKRNLGIKNAPQRWQDNSNDGFFDVVLTFEERVFDLVLEDMNNTRDHKLMRAVLIINLEVKDNHEEAAAGARTALELCKELETIESWEDEIDDLVAKFEREQERKILYSISFY